MMGKVIICQEFFILSLFQYLFHNLVINLDALILPTLEFGSGEQGCFLLGPFSLLGSASRLVFFIPVSGQRVMVLD